MKYRPLAELRISHPYYRSGRCPDLEVSPTPEGARVIANYRLVVKSRPDGFQVLAPLAADDTPFIDFAADTSLAFSLRARNPQLPLFTDLSALAATPAPRFSNPDNNPGGELTLGPGAPSPGLPSDRFAEVLLRGVNAAWLAPGPARFTLSLTSKRARWAYYLITDLRDGDIELVDADAATPVVFAPATGADLSAQPDPDDRQALQLAAQYPGARLLRFVSAAAVACAEEPRRKLELRLKGERLPLSLPNPLLTDYTSFASPVDTIPQRHESLFRVVKHLTHSFLPNG